MRSDTEKAQQMVAYADLVLNALGINEGTITTTITYPNTNITTTRPISYGGNVLFRWPLSG